MVCETPCGRQPTQGGAVTGQLADTDAGAWRFEGLRALYVNENDFDSENPEPR